MTFAMQTEQLVCLFRKITRDETVVRRSEQWEWASGVRQAGGMVQAPQKRQLLLPRSLTFRTSLRRVPLRISSKIRTVNSGQIVWDV